MFPKILPSYLSKRTLRLSAVLAFAPVLMIPLRIHADVVDLAVSKNKLDEMISKLGKLGIQMDLPNVSANFPDLWLMYQKPNSAIFTNWNDANEPVSSFASFLVGNNNKLDALVKTLPERGPKVNGLGAFDKISGKTLMKLLDDMLKLETLSPGSGWKGNFVTKASDPALKIGKKERENVKEGKIRELFRTYFVLAKSIIKLNASKEAGHADFSLPNNLFSPIAISGFLVKHGVVADNIKAAPAIIDAIQAVINAEHNRVTGVERGKEDEKKQAEKDRKELSNKMKLKKLESTLKANEAKQQAKLDKERDKENFKARSADNEKTIEAQKEIAAANQKKEDARAEKANTTSLAVADKNAQNATLRAAMAETGKEKRLKAIFEMVTSRKTATQLIAITAGVLTAFFGLRLFFKWLGTQNPKIFKFYRDPRPKYFWQFWRPKDKLLPRSKNKPIYNPRLQKTINDIVQYVSALIARKQNNTDAITKKLGFTNYTFTGPGGVGKTFLAEQILNISDNVAFGFIPAAAMMQMDSKEALIRMTEIFDWAEMLAEKGYIVILVWDEMDAIAAPRTSDSDKAKAELTNLFLARVPKPNHPYIMHIFITNLQLDGPFQTRSNSIEFTLPTGETIDKIVMMYLNYISNEFQLALDASVRDPRFLKQLRNLIEGMPPRGIEQGIQMLAYRMVMKGQGRITRKALYDVFEEKVRLEKESKKAAEKRALGGANAMKQPRLAAAAA